MDQDNAQLEARIATLERWKEERTLQQITYPLDVQSQEILAKYLMRISALINYEVVGAASHTVFELLGSQGQQSFQLSPQTIFQYTVDPTTDIFTTTTNFANDTQVLVNCTAAGSFPSPLAVNTVYFVVSSTGPSFKLSATSGGAAINITTAGTGSQYIQSNLT